MVVLAVGNVTSLATAPTITATGGNNKNTINAALSSNNAANVGASEAVSAGVNNTNKTNTNTNKTNSSNYNSSNGSSKLPYAGTGTTSVVLIALAFAGSAVYAYKKVTDYNL